MIEYKSFNCTGCENQIIKNYSAAAAILRGDNKIYYYFKCEKCGQQYYELLNNALPVPIQE